MSTIENQIKLAAKLYACRDAAKKLYGPEYEKKIGLYKLYIKACMLKHDYKDEISAAMRLIEDSKHIDGADMAAMNILAAAVEIIEPN